MCSLQREVEEEEGRSTQSFAAQASLDRGWALDGGVKVMEQLRCVHRIERVSRLKSICQP